MSSPYLPRNSSPPAVQSFLPQEQMVGLQFALSVGKRLPDGPQQNAMLGSKGPQYVSLDEVREGQRRRLLPRQIQARGEPSEPPSGRIGTSENPGPQRGGRQPQIAAGLGDRVSGLVKYIGLR